MLPQVFFLTKFRCHFFSSPCDRFRTLQRRTRTGGPAGSRNTQGSDPWSRSYSFFCIMHGRIHGPLSDGRKAFDPGARWRHPTRISLQKRPRSHGKASKCLLQRDGNWAAWVTFQVALPPLWLGIDESQRDGCGIKVYVVSGRPRARRGARPAGSGKFFKV